jgi:hypothetical protein
MKFLIHLIAESEVGQQVQEIACLERKEHRLEDIGLTLREAKKLLGAIQQRMVEQQVEEYLETQRSCPHCGRARGVKGSHTVMFPIVILLRTALPPQDAGSELTGTGCHGTRKLPG